MLRALSVVVFAGVLLLSWSAQAKVTYCVGGYEGRPRNVIARCDQPDIRRQHMQWHEHNYVTDGKQCFVCYDEQDNTCDTIFLSEHPDYSEADPDDCARLGEMHTADQLLAHVIDGHNVSPPALPPPPVQLEAKVEHITPGPYTAGDRIHVVGAVRAEDGTVRRVTGGTFRLTDASGKTTDYLGTVQRDGTVTADFALPATDAARIEFVPVAPPLGKGESLRSNVSAPQELKVEVCAFRARVVEPAEHASLVAGQGTDLRAKLFDAAGQVPVTPVPSGLELTFTVQVDGEAARTLQADGAQAASWTPPASPTPRQVRVSASGRIGERVVCPAGEVSVTVSDLGLGFDTSELPKTCYVGLPCRGTLKLVRPAPGPGRQRVDAVLADAATDIRVVDTGTERYRGRPLGDDTYTFEQTYSEVKNASWSVSLHTPRGDFAMPAHEVRVRPQLRLELPGELDFGTVPAGSAVTTACRQLDFSHSQAVEEHRWELEAQGLQGCQARPVLYFVDAVTQVSDVRPLSPKLEVSAMDPVHRWVDVCLEVPRCAGDVSPAAAVLHVAPLTPEFASQARTVRLRWKVEGRSLFACHASWLLPLLTGLGAMVLLAGFTRPARFSAGAALWVSGSEKGIRQAAAVLLRACPGSAPGFFRDARLGLHGDGNVTGRVRGAVVVLRATQGSGLVLQGHGPVERQDRRSLKWEPVDDLNAGHVPTPGVLYRSGGTFFKVEV